MTEEPLVGELAELFAAERAAPLTDAAMKAGVRAKLATSIAHLPLAGAGGLAAGKVLAAFAIVIGIGAGTVAVTKRAESTPNVPPPPAAALEHREVPAPEPPPVVQYETVPAAEPSRPARVVPRPSAPAATSGAPSQAQLLTRARTALDAGDATTALALVREDQTAHPDGALGEERAAIEILALAKLGNARAARDALAAFAARYPASVYRDRLDAVVADQEGP